ncbi:MAG: hypothetical protein KDE03_05225 [Rhodobacteraceae bacterium]|nr:hypothetical protein [Paracoccaceae bacterium]
MIRLVIQTTVLFAIGVSQANADPYEQAYSAAIEARDKCRSAWFQSVRVEALKKINDRGALMAATLNPLSPEIERNAQMLVEVTDALRECTKLTYPER